MRTLAALTVVLAPGWAVAAVPFVGCPADGQMGPIAAPHRPQGPVPPVAPAFERTLAYYEGPGIGVLAPRGWHCLDLYGSGGALLYVTPEPHGMEAMGAGTPLAGPAVVMEFINGENSGRFEVAQLVARQFPSFRAFVAEIVALDLLPRSDFSTGPYPEDKRVRRGRRVLEFTTPAHSEGLGTEDKVLSDDAAVQGVVKVRRRDFGMEARRLLVRMPSGMARLVPVVVQSVESMAP